MRRRLMVVLVFASVIGLLASLLVYRVVAEIRAAAGTSEEVVVAAVNMELAETITAKHVKMVAWPKHNIPAGAIRTLAEAEGRVVRSSIVAGEPLLEGKLAPQLSGRGGIMPMLVPEGQRGLTIKVDDAVKESGFVLPNSRIDLFVSMAKSPGSQEKMAKLILQDVLVLAAGQAVEMRDNKPVPVTTVTLSLTPEQAERLALAQTEGKLMLGTRNLRDKDVTQTSGVTRETLLAGPAPKATPAVAAGAAPRPRTVATAPLPVPAIDAHRVLVIRSSRETEQVFVRAGRDGWVEQKTEVKK